MPAIRLDTRYLTALLAFFIVMVSIGAIPGEANALSARFGDKLLHSLAFGFMAALAHQSLRGRRWHRMIGSLLIIATLGVIDESIQYFLPYRNASPLDWCFDVGAALIVTLLLCLRSPSGSHLKWHVPPETH